MYAKARKPKYAKAFAPKVEHLDIFDRMVLSALLLEKYAPDPDGKPLLPESVLTAARVECVTFELGRHQRAMALRPVGYSNWYRFDLDCWVSDPMAGSRYEDVHVTAPCHDSYVRAA